MKKINDKSQIASFYIGIVNNEKLLIASDRRCIVPVNGQFLIYDNIDKVFAINENVILTVAGIFNDGELFFAPFIDGADISNVDDACDVVQDYLIGLQAIDQLPSSRSYLIGGYNKDGVLTIANVSYIDEGSTIYVDKRTDSKDGLFVMYLPGSLLHEKDSYEKELNKMLANEEYSIDEAVTSFVNMISEKSKLVNSNVSYLYCF